MGKEQRTEAPDVGLSDEELVLRLAAGGQEALAPLYARYAPLVFSMAARALDQAAAEEIVQDVLLAVWRGAEIYDPQRGPVRPWVLQIARYRIINELRRRSRLPRTEPDPEGLRLLSVPDPEESPADAAWRAEHRDAVRSAVESLPSAQQQAVRLAFFRGLTHEQVAAELQVPLGTAKTRIRAGLQKLRLSLAPLVAAAVLAAGGLLALLGYRLHRAQEQRQLEHQALALAADSESSVLHLSPAPGYGDATHGSFRTHTGEPIAVLHVESLPRPAKGEHYEAWLRFGERWVPVAPLHLDGSGSALLILQGDELKTLPDEVRVTPERGTLGRAPAGPAVISWTRQ
jgi:RNA polymerase sigma-70 factor (ECF subfamily)